MKYSIQILLVAAVLNFNAAAQIADSTRLPKKGSFVEFMVFPTLLYNSATIGVGFQKNALTEHVINLTGIFVWEGMGYYSSAAARYNYNLTIGNYKRIATYLPLWLTARYLEYSGNGEEGMGPFQTINYTIGTGYGMKYYFKNRHQVRIEFGVGAAYFMIIDPSRDREWLRSIESSYKNSIAPAFRLNVRYIIPFSN
jgi:hypothetical protein